MATNSNPLVVSAEQYNLIYNSKGDGSEVGITPLEMFEFQLRALRAQEFGFSDQEVDRLRPFIPEQGLRFLLVPPRLEALSLNGLVARIKTNGSTLGKSEIENVVDTIRRPLTAHLLWDVEDGRGRLGVKPNVSVERIGGGEANRIHGLLWRDFSNCFSVRIATP